MRKKIHVHGLITRQWQWSLVTWADVCNLCFETGMPLSRQCHWCSEESQDNHCWATSSHHWLEIIIRQISTNWASTEISSISSSLLYSSVTFYLAISNIGKCFDWGTVFLSRDHDRWSWNGRWKYKNSVWSISGDCRELKSQFLSSVDVSGPPRNSNK